MNRRSLVISVLVAMLVAGLASRVNRRLLPEAPRPEPVLHELIADVAIDPRTFKRAVESLSSKTSAKLVIDEELMPAVEAEEATLGDNAAPQIQRFHDVQLGILLVRLLARWEDQMSMDCRIDGRTITFCTPRVAGAIERRCYDLRRFTKDWVAWSDLAWSWGPRGGRGGGGRWGSGGAMTGESVDERAAERLVQFFRDQVVRERSTDFEVIASWAGCVIVEAPRESHNQFARFLEMWANSPVIREMPVGRSGFPRVLAERFLSPARPGNDIERLNKIISTVKCKAMPLEKFMDAIADATGSAFYADWHQLAGGAAVGPLSPVTLDLKNVSAGDALQQALDQCRLTGSPLGFVSVDGLVTVSMQSRVDRSRTIRIYDMRDLIKKVAETNLKIAGPRPIPQDDEEFVLPNVKFQMNSENAAADNIRSGLLASVSNSASPGLCEISYFSGRFAIAGTIQQHELIAAALGAMRAKVEQDLKWQR